MLTVLHDDNNVFKDFSLDFSNFEIDEGLLELNSAEDYLYVGLYKPFSKFWVEIKTANALGGSFTAEYFNGTSWVSIGSTFLDETRTFSRSGFISFSRDLSKWAATSVNGIEKYYIRLRPSVSFSGVEVWGIGLVFSSDQDLRNVYRDINAYKNPNDNSFIIHHVEAKDRIIQLLRNQGKIKVKETIVNQSSTTTLLDIDEYDILRPEQLRNASKYYAISSIFANASNSIDSQEWKESEKYQELANKALDTFLLSIDSDDDGIEDEEENNKDRSITIEVL